ncbi:iron-sulfur cluster repair protein YtfE [Orrella marina]|uniref:Iron-sulfur cluster repair di-iron protein n=1 Tax=Orrella marina TaxID=2163011 RepID=A0A2R4XN85_9BURK|nr:iron-sulfur cluster repair protein YtfE [Orrella marina]AWB35234.1 iron-sulfur cluster repair di-iron protein [Orrella marina]
MHQLLDQTIGHIACELPGATRVFHANRLDFCCGGDKTLREAMASRKIADPGPIVMALQELAGQQTLDGRDWRKASPGELIDHILTRFHDKHREDLPELIRLARRVEHVHRDHHACPRGLADHLAQMQQELESHMMKEEQVLFPMLRRVDAAQVPAPVAMMRFEHDQHGEALDRIDQLTTEITAPSDACNTWRGLYAGLRQLREDLMQHIHLENNILFISAQDLHAA